MDRLRLTVHVLMYVKLYGLVRNLSCTALHCPCHTVIGREREREGEEGRERGWKGERGGGRGREGERDGESKL